jgi:arsenate reductase (thioredoxin)
MAETWAHHLFPADWVANSAGLLTHRITSRTKAAMAEVGLDMAGQVSKTFDSLDLDSYDLCVTLSQSSSKYFPELADPDRHIKLPINDPMSAKGSDEEIVEAFRRGRDQIKEIVMDVCEGKLVGGK